jgi:hypothetical protein
MAKMDFLGMPGIAAALAVFTPCAGSPPVSTPDEPDAAIWRGGQRLGPGLGAYAGGAGYHFRKNFEGETIWI